MANGEKRNDIDPAETDEWLDAMEAVLERDGLERGHFLLEALIEKSRRNGAYIPFSPNTAYLNTIPPHQEARSPGDADLEWRLRCIIRWNAMAMVVRANRKSKELGGHIASFASSATLYDVGFNHFWRAEQEGIPGDFIFFQGHSAPGIYARAFVEGRLSENELDNFRQEATGDKGLSSYPHPWLMPDFWQFPTVSMGLGPIMAIYQARFMKYLENRGLIEANQRKVWCFIGDGETDEPETLGAISLAGREGLDNLVFVVNCNLQRLDGPVRGNGKIIQELEGDFRGSGWNVLKVIWGSYWDPLLSKDSEGLLKQLMEETVDGEYQNFKAKGGAYTREKFFGKYPKLKEMVATMSDADIWRLNRGGHDPHKVYAAYHEAVNGNHGLPTVILAKTVKGYGMGEAGEAQNTTHQQKVMDDDEVLKFRDRFNIPLSDEEAIDLPYFRPADDSPEGAYIRQRREALKGYLPKRTVSKEKLEIPKLSAFDAQLQTTGEREISTTMAFVRILNTLLRDKNIGKRIVPIVPDESRTFGMEGLFRQIGIYNPKGQLYTPEDSDQLQFYKEDKKGQVLQEGINEAGGMCDWIAAATSYAQYDLPMIPFFIYYSMFGFQRIGDLAWAAGDMQARGFLMGGTAGRTTLAGEGLQHQDGHSHILAGTIPNCVTYDPTYAYELAVIVQDGLRRMYVEHESVFYYITVMNENYAHPQMPEGVEAGILKGMYQLHRADRRKGKKHTVQLLGSGTILREVEAASLLLQEDFGIAADVWSCTSFNELARDGRDASRFNLLHPTATPRKAWVTEMLDDSEGPIIACTDYIRNYVDQIREFVPRRYSVLGTDGFGR
ncbi:pyruvate dehydrogenase (acetyl-transferring), homodimeric type, partial [Gammaproteobacteria bacterium]|nr:pyruvate dehydrogenase (acetyl-transferring), homodimeric type [Gammaproteobacteria bacterium]